MAIHLVRVVFVCAQFSLFSTLCADFDMHAHRLILLQPSLCLKTLGHPAVNRSTIHPITLQFQCCCKFSRCASMAASPTVGDVKPLNKLARQIKSQPVKLQFWPLTGPLRIVGFLDASCRNNEGGSSQRGMTVFFGRIA